MLGATWGIGPGCVAQPIGACADRCSLPNVKYIRIAQWITGALFLSFTVLLMWHTKRVFSTTPYIQGVMVFSLSGGIWFISTIDVISQFSGDPIPDTPMFILGIFGTIMCIWSTGWIYWIRDNIPDDKTMRYNIWFGTSATCAVLYFFDAIQIFMYGY